MRSRQGARRAVVATALAVLAVLPCAAASAAPDPAPQPYGTSDAGGFRNVLPAGEAGVDNISDLGKNQANGTIPPHFADQLPLYRNLVYADPTLTVPQVSRYFKDATFGVKPADVVSVQHPEAGLTIVRDKWDVPHVYGQHR